VTEFVPHVPEKILLNQKELDFDAAHRADLVAKRRNQVSKVFSDSSSVKEIHSEDDSEDDEKGGRCVFVRFPYPPSCCGGSVVVCGW
jgi:hypothetical protein